jgi:hypothetical protein
MTAIALILPTLLGFLTLAILLRNDHDAGLVERLCFSYPLGTGFLTMQMFVLGLLRVQLTLMNTSLPILTEILLLSVIIAIQKITVVPKLSFRLRDELLSPNTSRVKKVAVVLLILWACVKLLSVFLETGLRPIFAWDAWANWSVGAKLFYATKSLLLDSPPQDFFASGAVLRITAYPLHNPMMQMWISLWNGGFDEVLVKFWNPVYLLCLAVCLYLLAREELNNNIIALVMLVIFLSSQLMSYHAIEAYSDLALSVYLMLAAISFLHAMRGREAFWILTGVFSAEALFTKDEALFFVAPLFLSSVIYIWRNSIGIINKRRQILKLALPLLLVAPWYFFKFSHALGLGANHIKLEFTFHPEIIFPALQQIYSLENFNVIIIFFPLFLLLSGKPSQEFLHIFFVMASFAAFFFALYIFTTFYYDHFSRGTVFFRNILTYYPVIGLLTILLLKSIFISIKHKEPRIAVAVSKKKKRK